MHTFHFLRRYQKGIIYLISAMYLAGLLGLAFPASRALFLALTPFHLIITGALLLLLQRPVNPDFWLAAGLVFAGGFAVEWVGVHTGAIFGTYRYGPTLGLKIDQIPVLIGLNWLVLVYAVSGMLRRYINQPALIALVGSLLLVALDALIEPVAPPLNFWQFAGGLPGWHNYLGWLVAGFMLIFLFSSLVERIENPLTAWVLFWQFVFFGGLYLIL